jgi:hypothetical protein
MGFRTKLMLPNLDARDLPERISATFNDAAIVLTDPSRERSQVLMQFAKPIPFALLFDNKATALDDSANGRVKESLERIYVPSSLLFEPKVLLLRTTDNNG